MKSRTVRHELPAGWIVHYVTGASVALTYPVLSLALGASWPAAHLGLALPWGLATTLLPWLVLYPAFGWGLFGVRAPTGTRPVLSASVAHLLYGFGVGFVVSMASRLMVLDSTGAR